MIAPMFDRIVIRPLSPEPSSTLVMPDKYQPKSTTGLVLAVGDGLMKKNGEIRKPAVNPGDKVMFRANSGTKVEVEGEVVLLVREQDIYGVFVE